MHKKKSRAIAKGMIALSMALIVGIGSAFFPMESDAEKGDEELAVDPMNSSEGYSAVLYDNTNGLPTSEANAIAETSEGFIWIGSYSGLIRYDGSTFERIDSTTGISSVVSLFVDSKDRLWVGTNDSGVAIIDKGNVRMFSKKDGLKAASIRSIMEDNDGNTYVAMTQGVAKFDKNMKFTEMKNPQIEERYIWELQMGADGVIYGLTNSDEIFTIENGEITNVYDMTNAGVGNVISMYPDPGKPNYFYIGSNSSEVYYGKWEDGFVIEKEFSMEPLSYIKNVKVINNQLFVCADNGIGIVEGDKTKILQNVPLNNSIDHVMADYEGNLWFTSSRQGVMKIVPNQFVNVNEEYKLPTAVVNSTCKKGSYLYIGTDTGLVVVNKKGMVEKLRADKVTTASGKVLFKDTNLISLLEGVRIRSIIRDSENRLWFSTYGAYGLLRYDGKNVLCFTMEDGLPSDRMRTVFERKDKSMLLACTGGAVIIEGNKIKKIYNETNGMNNTEILTAIEAENGDLILGSDGDGIYILSPTNKLTHLNVGDGLNSDVVMRVKKDVKRDIFWIVTSNSIAYMTSDYKITTIKKFPYSNNFDLYENSRGEMWVLSSNGIYVISAEKLIANKAIEPVFYSKDNGLPCIATANSYSDISEEGELYISGTTGVARVNIENIFETVNNVKMAVPFVDADGKRVYPDKDGKITLASDVKRLTIYSYVYTYSLMNPQVTYYLEGFESKKNTMSRSDLKPVDYTNLKGGKYRFIVQLKDSMGRGDKELAVNIVKKKGIREMGWYRILRILVLMLLVAMIVQYYFYRKTKALYKKQQENKLFIREMTEAFARTVDMKDRYTNGHSTRVAEYTVLLAKELGYDEETIDKYYYIALLHDIGKIGVPSTVLNKNGKLTDEEFAIIKSHSAKGYQALKDISIMPDLAIGAGAHHERPDGNGYPKGLKGEEIPRVAQVIAVADTFDAMYSDRPYRKRMNFEKAVSIIKEVAGTQLAPDVVEAFLRLVEKGYFRAPDDNGGGTTEDIDNIHKKQEEL